MTNCDVVTKCNMRFGGSHHVHLDRIAQLARNGVDAGRKPQEIHVLALLPDGVLREQPRTLFVAWDIHASLRQSHSTVQERSGVTVVQDTT